MKDEPLMMTRLGLAWCAVLLALAPAAAAPSPLPPADTAPVLRLDAGGPTAFVTALAFSPDGRTLYAAAWDKVVHVWTANEDGRFVPGPRAYRVPVGPGQDGLLNALALSDDGVWLATGGTGVYRGRGGFRVSGQVVSLRGDLDDQVLRDQGLIYVFNTQTGEVRLLRGVRGSVAGLAFAPTRAGEPVQLVSTGRELKDRATDTWAGTVRLWDLAQAKCLDSQWLPDPELLWHRGRPSLAAWYAPGGGLMAALGWGDGNLYLWDQANDALRRTADARNDPVAYLPDRDLAVTGLFGTGKARLRLWQVAPGKDPTLSAEEPIAAGDPDVLPWALGLVSENANGRADDAAVVTRKQTPQGIEFGLQLLSLQGGGGLGGVRADVPVLWRNTGKLPVVASSLRGPYLAVAGNDDHEVLVYRVADLVQGQAHAQVLRGSGAFFRAVAFARKGKDMGLLLNALPKKHPGDPPRRPADADALFDFTARRVTTDTGGWRTDTPEAGGWEVQQPDPQKPALSVTRDGKPVKAIRLEGDVFPKGLRITDFALLPPTPRTGVPLLAVAWNRAGVPGLSLFNADSGDYLREYAGHTGPISCLAFSGDGRLLVSCSEDQTVSVWSLANLVLGKYGALTGVAVTKGEGGALTVAAVAAGTPARGLLHRGDVILGLVQGGALRPPEDPRAFYEAVRAVKPGDTVTLRVKDADGAARDVAVEVGEATTEHKPLLSLFFMRPDRTGEREWVGWNPLGPYEAADAHAETEIGWHFNTNRAEAPTRFLAAGEYHDKYYRQGLLAELVAQGKLPDRVSAPKLPAPKLIVGVREGEGATAVVPLPDAHGHLFVRSPAVTLVVQVGGRSLASLGAVVWQVDDEPEHAFDLKRAAGQMLTAPLTLTRGIHKLTVRARDPEAEAGGYPAETRLVRFQPPAPRLKYDGEASQTVKQAKFTLKLDLRAGAAGEPVTVRRSQTVRGKVEDQKEEEVAADPEEPTALKYDFLLRPGRNVLEVVAVNRKALAGFEEEETFRLPVEVTLIEKARPPVLTLEGVVPDGAPPGQPPLDVHPDRPVRMTAPSARIKGKIEAGEALVKAEWSKGDAAAVPLTGFGPGRKELALDEAVQLAPGQQTFTFRAKTATSDEAEAAVTLDYQPPVPTALITAPANGSTVYGEKDTGEVTLEAQLTLPRPLHAYKAKVLVDGKEPDDPPPVTIDEAARRLTARVPLHPGTNRLQVRLSNKWGALFTSAPVEVEYLRPPRVVKLIAPEESKDPAIDLEAKVRSSRPLLPEMVKVEVNGAPSRARATVAEDPPHSGNWTVRVPGVALDPGTEQGVAVTSRIVFRVSSDEGECREPGQAAVVYRPPVTPPVLAVSGTDEDGDQLVQDPDFRVAFRVTSAAKITKAQVVREIDKPLPADLATVVRKKDGTYELKAELSVRLQPKLNLVRVEAANEGGGEVGRTLRINYVPRPAELVLDSLAVEGGPVLEPLPGHPAEFPPVPAGRVQLRGRVRWDRDDAPGLREARVVRVFVNGFQQQPQPLQPAAPGSREREFQTDLLLTRADDDLNQVSLSVPQLDKDAVTHFTLRCTQPEKAQRLHLLMVSPTQKDPKALEAQLFQVFGVSGPPSHLKAKAFDPVYPYGPLVGDFAGPEFVNGGLLQIQQSIRQRTVAAGLPSADLVVIYYRGRELLDKDGNLFPTGDEEEPAIRPDRLAEVFEDTPGAYVLLLDVERPAAAAADAGPDKLAAWKHHFPKAAQNASVYRFAWLGSGAVPANERLIAALQKAMPGSVTLQDVTRAVRKFAAQAPDFKKKNLLADEEVAPEMNAIAVNGR